MGRSKGKQPVTGFGCYVDVNTGAKTINPGMPSEEVVSEFSHEVAHDPDVNVRFPIPNEKEIRSAVQFEKEIDVPAYRSISFKGDGAQVQKPTNLPFEPPGLHWKGKKAISTRQLLNKT
ncbi:unnamed protein product [Cuscuta epithymum]|uniref:Uncharacterized protein n=1 Tax=Cuscuta epithymum TaxID=186058 RepID=A0AAV0C2I0_9ASTE|nr:unnamed protein product [Cuscuta epithymum]